MPELGSWKNWLLWPLRSRFGKAPEPWQARPPPQVEPQFRREVTRPPPSAAEPEQPDELPALSAEEIELLGMSEAMMARLKLFGKSDNDFLRFLGWDVREDGRFAIFRVEHEEKPDGYYFSERRYCEVEIAGSVYTVRGRPDAHLEALRNFRERFGEPTAADLANPYSDYSDVTPSP